MSKDIVSEGVKAPEKSAAAELSAGLWSGSEKAFARQPAADAEAKIVTAGLLGNLTITNGDSRQRPEAARQTGSSKPGEGNQALLGHTLASVAGSFDGAQVWRNSKYADLTIDGKYGCAASLSLVLRKAGFKYADSPVVGQLVSQLERHGWTPHPASGAREGDVMVGYNQGTNWKKGGGNAHTGVVRADGTVYNNSSRQNMTWVAEAPDVAFGQYTSRYVLRPPQKQK
jgi:hypothetical protein